MSLLQRYKMMGCIIKFQNSLKFNGIIDKNFSLADKSFLRKIADTYR